MSETLDVGVEGAGARVDRWLAERLPALSRARAKRLAEEGLVRVNGRRVRKSHRLEAGDVVVLEVALDALDARAVPDPDLPLSVLLEDADLVVVDKAAGVPSHPLRAGERGTVANALLARYPEMAGVGYSDREPGLVHRLDVDTSGALLAARGAEAFERLRAALRAGRVDKRYVALVEGVVVAPRVVDVPIANRPGDQGRVRVCEDARDAERLHARAAMTEVLATTQVGAGSLVEVRAHTATRHQVRAHLAALGHPLVGDVAYGGPVLPGLARHFLHASVIAFEHPRTGAAIEVRAPMPAELAAALDRLRDGAALTADPSRPGGG
ncbi:MAG: RluA family pseudouridine synthase [Myxococcales bacterium]|nr:RluA family pseudouridine synthase [Myxococcales bacterium]